MDTMQFSNKKNEHDVENDDLFVKAVSFQRIVSGKEKSRTLRHKDFINIINYSHFMGNRIFAHIKVVPGNEDFLMGMYPEPCTANGIWCRFHPRYQESDSAILVKNLIVDDGKSIYVMPVTDQTISGNLLSVQMGIGGFIFQGRKRKRFLCLMVDARLSYDAKQYEGVLEDYSPSGLRLTLDREVDLCCLPDIPKKSLTVELRKNGDVIFRGPCEYLSSSRDNKSIVVRPLNIPYARFRKRRLRNPRLRLAPTPKVLFKHPLTDKTVIYNIKDITTSGFSVQEQADNMQLIPGMIVPDVTILYHGSQKAYCSAQVVYSKRNAFTGSVKQGFSILDMGMKDYCQLYDIVSNAYDPNANMSSDIDMENLWEFFFESGFIYPKKYEYLSRIKEEFKNSYRILYQEGNDIFTNFTYQRNGRILGHNCTIRAYQRAWMIHHLAAISSGARRIGLDVMRHSHYFFDGMYRLPSIGMDYMIMYFRPENAFPNFFFRGFCQDYNKMSACSLDLFAYLTHQFSREKTSLPDGWKVESMSAQDVHEFRAYYALRSGGLMCDAFGVGYELPSDEETLDEAYSRIGLLRKSTLYTIKCNNEPRAYLIVDQSNTGLNLSELINSVKIFIIDNEKIPWDVVECAINSLKDFYPADTIKLMVYPVEYMNLSKVHYDKKYYLWILNTEFGDDYVEYIKKKLSFNMIKFFIKYMQVKLLKR